MNCTHTPGPWSAIRPSHPCSVVARISGPSGDAHHYGPPVFAPLSRGPYDDTEAHLNLVLIAAAPDLLDLARAVAAHFADTDAPLGARASALIAQATTATAP